MSTIYKGKAWVRRLTVVREDTGAAQDLTSATITFRGKHLTSDAIAPVDLSIGNGIALVGGGTGGLADITIDGATSAVLDVDSLICACVVTLPGDPEPKVVLPPFRVAVRELP